MQRFKPVVETVGVLWSLGALCGCGHSGGGSERALAVVNNDSLFVWEAAHLLSSSGDSINEERIVALAESWIDYTIMAGVGQIDPALGAVPVETAVDMRLEAILLDRWADVEFPGNAHDVHAGLKQLEKDIDLRKVPGAGGKLRAFLSDQTLGGEALTYRDPLAEYRGGTFSIGDLLPYLGGREPGFLFRLVRADNALLEDLVFSIARAKAFGHLAARAGFSPTERLKDSVAVAVRGELRQALSEVGLLGVADPEAETSESPGALAFRVLSTRAGSFPRMHFRPFSWHLEEPLGAVVDLSVLEEVGTRARDSKYQSD